MGGGKKKRGNRGDNSGQPSTTNLENPFGDDWQKMSTEFLKWGKDQLSLLAKNKDQDFTDMIKYLMSLDDENTTRDVITQYLGTSSKVQLFADGFLVRKEFDQENQSVQKHNRHGDKKGQHHGPQGNNSSAKGRAHGRRNRRG